MTSDPTASIPPDVLAIDACASKLMKQGIRLLNDTGPDAVAQALNSFDRALELRRHLPLQAFPILRYGLAACWLNRADALARLEDAGQIVLALHAYDEAIVLLHSLRLRDDPRFLRRLAIAHQNRGLALHTFDSSTVADAVAAFTAAVAVLESDSAALIADRHYLLATVWMNLAKVRVSQAAEESESLAKQAALQSMALLAASEDHDANAADVSLKARHVLCQAVARRLSRSFTSRERMPDEVHDATDATDDGLNLVRRWERNGVTRFRGVAYDLFRFGIRVYERYQPQFLDEFVREHLDPARSSSDYVESAEMRAAAREVRER